MAAALVGGLLAIGVLDTSALRVAIGPRVRAWIEVGGDQLHWTSVDGTSRSVRSASVLYLETPTVRVFHAGDADNALAFAVVPVATASDRAHPVAGRGGALGPPATLSVSGSYQGIVVMRTANGAARILTWTAWSGFLTTARVRTAKWEQPLAMFSGSWILASREGSVRAGRGRTTSTSRLLPGEPYVFITARAAPVVVAVNQPATLEIQGSGGSAPSRARLAVAHPRSLLRTYVGLARRGLVGDAVTRTGVVTARQRGTFLDVMATHGRFVVGRRVMHAGANRLVPPSTLGAAAALDGPDGVAAIFDQATHVSSNL